MPRISELVEATAKATGIPHRLVNLYARRLIDNGILPKGRGSVGGWVNFEHAAALLIALWSTDRPADGPAKVKMWGDITVFRFGGGVHLGETMQFHLSERIESASDLEIGDWRYLHFTYYRFQREPIDLVVGKFLEQDEEGDAKFFSYYWSHLYHFDVEGHYIIEESSRRIEAVLDGHILCRLGAFFAGVTYDQTIEEMQEEMQRILRRRSARDAEIAKSFTEAS